MPDTDRNIRLRGAPRASETHRTNNLPDEIIYRTAAGVIAESLLHGTTLTGNAFERVWARAVDGEIEASPSSLIDVRVGETAWSCKTIQGQPRKVRLIVGRCDPRFSMGNEQADPGDRGRDVLDIYNERIARAQESSRDLRIVILMRKESDRRYGLFERPLAHTEPSEYEWAYNQSGNLEGHSLATGEHGWTWQPGGAQLTRVERVPPASVTFFMADPVPRLSVDAVLEQIGYSDDWVTIKR